MRMFRTRIIALKMENSPFSISKVINNNINNILFSNS